MAEIFKAKKEGLGGFERLFALKRVSPEYARNAEYVDMLVEEAKIAGLLNHANIVQIVDLGQTTTSHTRNGVHQWPQLGRAIERLRSRGNVLPVPHAVFICLELLKALEYAQPSGDAGGLPVPPTSSIAMSAHRMSSSACGGRSSWLTLVSRRQACAT